MCLLSDVALDGSTSDTASIQSEDVFYDAQSEFSDSLALFNDASSYNAASIDSPEDSFNASAISSEADASPPAIPTAVETNFNASAGTSAVPAVSETYVKVSSSISAAPTAPENKVKASASTSGVSTTSETRYTTSIPATSSPNSTTPILTLTDEHGTTTIPPEVDEEEDLLDLFYSPPSHTRATLYNIPLPHTITPITPDFTKPPSYYRPRPQYPTLSGRYNVRALAAQGARIVEDHYRVLIGPLSAVAREEWRGDCGRGYLRSKLGRPISTSDGGDGRRDRGGVEMCQMVKDDAGVWYVLAMFENHQRARDAEAFLQGFAW